MTSSLITMTFAICLRYAETPDAAIRCAVNEAHHFATRLELVRPMTIRLVSGGPPNSAGQWAWTRRSKSGSGCDIDLMPKAARDIATVAHEVCHCKMHYQYMTTGGGVTISGARLEAAEEEARQCAWRLTE